MNIMPIPQFGSDLELFDYVVEHGPKLPPEVIKNYRAGEIADGLIWYLNDIGDPERKDELDALVAVIRQNIKLVSGDESDIELADMVGAPWDCFAEE